MHTWSKRFRKKWRSKNSPCHYDCLCDFHEGVTERLKSRAVRNRPVLKEIREYLGR